eukprot:g3202.t1
MNVSHCCYCAASISFEFLFRKRIAQQCERVKGVVPIATSAMQENDESDSDTEGEQSVFLNRALQARSKCLRLIKDAAPKGIGPVEAIAEAAWQNDPTLTAGDSLLGFAVGIGESFGPVFANLTFGSSYAIKTDDGLVLIDCGSRTAATTIFNNIRNWMPNEKISTVVYTHGHIDHVSWRQTGFVEEAIEKEWPRPTIVAHENVPKRFDRYLLTRGFNSIINRRQFQLPNAFEWPGNDYYEYPTVTYKDMIIVKVGGEQFEIYHEKGETDDASVVWWPKHRYIFVGDLFIWATPNCGNPQKIQRHPQKWRDALQRMVHRRPRCLFPGHGPPIIGEERVHEALSNTTRLLDIVLKHAITRLNEGMPLAEIMRSLRIPPSLLALPYLAPKYDDPRFIVASIWRKYCGWWGGEITQLLPSDKNMLAKEICQLIGGQSDRNENGWSGSGAYALLKRAEKLAKEGKIEVATDLVEIARLAAPKDPLILRGAADVIMKRSKAETSLMAKSIFRASAIDSKRRAKNLNKKSRL